MESTTGDLGDDGGQFGQDISGWDGALSAADDLQARGAQRRIRELMAPLTDRLSTR
jgi:hypothetical protein